MLLKTLLPSLYHRRLLLLLALFGMSTLPLGAKLAHLTLVKGEASMDAAEARLSRTVQTPTVRGMIIDRKGRVLAQDRPSYDIAVKYEVITGDWARRKAREAARHAAGSGWSELSPAAREAETQRYLPTFQVHLDRAWDVLAARAGVTRAEVDSRRDQVIATIESRAANVAQRRREQAYEDAKQRGVTLSAASIKSIERSAGGKIAEMEQSHVLVRRVPDAIGLAVQVLAGEDIDLDLPGPEERLSNSRSEHSQRVERVPGLIVLDSGDREYAYDVMNVSVDRASFPTPVRSEGPISVTVTGVARHAIGGMRDRVLGSAPATATSPPFAGDAQRRATYLDSDPAQRARAYAGLGADRGSYREGDRVGDSGVESAWENRLRGLRGVRTTQLSTGEKFVVEPEPGEDVQLTLDISLQARVQAVMSPQAGLAIVQPWHKQESATQPVGTPLNGAAVVIDVRTGDILALVSSPSPSREEIATKQPDLLADLVGTPLVDRATQKFYTPGSIVKPLMFVEATKRGVFDVGDRIACTGRMFDRQPNAFRCWIYKKFSTTHNDRYGHDLDAEEAIMCSCNIFFYTIGRRLGPAGIIAAYEDFGVGRTFDLGTGYQSPGGLGFPRKSGPTRGIQSPDAMQMGIGQGPVTWTPVHAAAAYATLARGGIDRQPRLVKNALTLPERDLGLRTDAVQKALAGLKRSVGDHEGTGNHIMIDGVEERVFTIEGVDVWGKTGTAAAPRIFDDPDGRDGPAPPELLEEGDHSWYVVLVGHGEPWYAVAVVIDYGGSGGKVSGPIVNQVVNALVTEGYL